MNLNERLRELNTGQHRDVISKRPRRVNDCIGFFAVGATVIIELKYY